MKKLLPAALFLMAVLTAPAQELPLLKWSSKDQQSLMLSLIHISEPTRP